ncbi:MAG: tetratricopeptide repeat protein, partial [Mariprofundus sp.]
MSTLLVWGITGGVHLVLADVVSDARQYMQEGNDDQAVFLLEPWVRKHATNHEAFFLLGILYAQQEKYTKAIEMFHQVSALQPKLAEPHGNLAVIYNALGEPEAAARELKTFLHKRPGDPVILENLGDIQIQLALKSYQT